MRYLFSVILVIKCVTSNCQIEDSIRGIHLDSMVYTSTRLAKPIDQIGRSITILNHEQLQEYGTNSLSEVLSLQTGMSIVGSTQTPGQLQNIFSRGNNSNQSNILIDGMRVNNPFSTNNVLDLSEFALTGVNRIEIIRGNHSSLYGPSSVGSTINLISIDPNAKSSKSSLSLRTGTFGKNTFAFEPSVNLYFQNERGWYTQFGSYYNHTKGINAVVDTITDKNNFKYLHNDQEQFTKLDYWASIGKRNEHGNTTLSYRHHNNKSDLDKGAFQDDDNYNSEQTRDLIGIKSNHQFHQKFSMDLSSSLSNLQYRYADDSSIINSFGKSDQTYLSGHYNGLSVNNDLSFSWKEKYLDILLGFSQNYDQMKYHTFFYSGEFNYESKVIFENHSLNLVGAFVQCELDGKLFHRSLNNYQLTLNGRQSYSSQFGSFFTYGVNPSYKYKNALLYLNYSTGFTTPSIYQLYSGEKNFESGITRGNPFLKSESSQTFEIGIKQKLNSYSSINLSVFKNNTRNAIDYVYLWDASKNLSDLSYLDYKGDTYVNLGSLQNNGIEIEYNTNLSKRIRFGAKLSLIDGHVQYLSSGADSTHIGNSKVQIFNSGVFVSNENKKTSITRRPSTSNLYLTYKPSESFSLTISYRYVSARFDHYYNELSGPFGALSSRLLEDYQLLNLYASYHLSKRILCAVQVENMLNQKYDEIIGYSAKGRGIYLQLMYTIQ